LERLFVAVRANDADSREAAHCHFSRGHAIDCGFDFSRHQITTIGVRADVQRLLLDLAQIAVNALAEPFLERLLVLSLLRRYIIGTSGIAAGGFFGDLLDLFRKTVQFVVDLIDFGSGVGSGRAFFLHLGDARIVGGLELLECLTLLLQQLLKFVHFGLLRNEKAARRRLVGL
jgi:hypothetical protein